MKQLGIDVQVDIVRKFAGKLWAYAPVIQPNGMGLGVAVANEPGYYPVPLYHFNVDNYDEAVAEADRLNEQNGKTHDAAIDIVTSSMFPREGAA